MRGWRVLARAIGVAAGAALSAVAGAPGALAGTLEVRWMQPAGGSRVTAFRVYQGAVAGEGDVVFQGLPMPVDGIYSVLLEIPEVDVGTTFYLWVTAVGVAGESSASNSVRHRRETGPVGQPGPPHFVLE